MFTKFGLGERVPGEHPHAKFHRCSLKIWVYSPQNWYFLYKFAQNRYTPLSNVYKIWFGGGSPTSATPHPHAKFHRCGFKIWVYSPENCQNWYFCINLPKMGIPLKRCLQNLAWGESKVRTLMPNFTVVAWACSPKIVKNGNFLVQICP